MPNTTVPAAAEGVPTDPILYNRIRELMKELATLLDRTRSGAASFATVHAASSGRANIIGFDLDLDGPSLSTLLIRGEDDLNEASSFVDLVHCALEGMDPDRDINALQYGVREIRKALGRAHEAIEAARDQI